MNKNNIIGKCNNFTHCKYKGENITLNTFKFKGCWNCHYFEGKEDFPFYDVKEAASILNKSKSTIRRWINKGKLDGKLFRKQKKEFSLGPWKKYYIKMLQLFSDS